MIIKQALILTVLCVVLPLTMGQNQKENKKVQPFINIENIDLPQGDYRHHFYTSINGSLYPFYEIINAQTGKKIDLPQEFTVNQTVDLIIKFRKFKTIRQKFTISEEPNYLRIQGSTISLVPLKSYEFQSKMDNVVLDGIQYSLKMYLDDKPVEEHLLKKEKGLGRFIWTIQADPTDKVIKIVAGYKSVSKPLKMIGTVNYLPDIEIKALVKHLDTVFNKNRQEALLTIEKLLRETSFRLYLRRAPKKNTQLLLNLISRWSFEKSIWKEKQIVIQKNLEKEVTKNKSKKKTK